MTRRPLVPAAALLVAALLALAATAAGCGGKSSKSGASTASSKSSPFQGAVADPPKPAPPLQLKDSTGKPFDLASFRGKVVLVTFLYTHCPDVCPLIAGNLHTTLGLLGAKASNVQVVAVSTDPRGDNPKTVRKFLAAHQMTGKMRYLIGSAGQLQGVWKRWGIVARPDTSSPDKVEHSAPIYGIAASGKITTLYPANFKPPQIAHDVPLLAKQ